MSTLLSEMTLEELWVLFPIILSDHRDYWKSWYEEEESRISEFLPMEAGYICMSEEKKNYDKIGLLKPEKIESTSNYRFYCEKQIVRANRIQVLKSLSFGLSEISEILIDDSLDDRIKVFLEGRYGSLQGRRAVWAGD